LNREPLRIAHYYRDAGRPSGVTAAIAGWQAALAELGADVTLLYNGTGEWALPSRSIRHVGRGRQGEIAVGTADFAPFDLVVLHEGWITSNYAAAVHAHRAGVPYVVMPHGVYEPQVMRGLGARSARTHLERRYIGNAAAIHAFYPTEIERARAVGTLRDAFAVPTGFDAPRERTNAPSEYAAWFGRYAVDHKGLDRLIHLWALIPPAERPLLKLRGVDYHGGKAQVVTMVEALNLQSWVSVGGPLQEDDKADFLTRASVFLFPSRWESQGISLIEALACGVPSVVSNQCHIAASLADDKAAEVVDFNDWMEVVRAVSRARDNGRLSFSARQYVASHLNWRETGAATLRHYTRIAS
jgi:glycosyltransferase involved in cell wall biosynthesis